MSARCSAYQAESRPGRTYQGRKIGFHGVLPSVAALKMRLNSDCGLRLSDRLKRIMCPPASIVGLTDRINLSRPDAKFAASTIASVAVEESPALEGKARATDPLAKIHVWAWSFSPVGTRTQSGRRSHIPRNRSSPRR